MIDFQMEGHTMPDLANHGFEVSFLAQVLGKDEAELSPEVAKYFLDHLRIQLRQSLIEEGVFPPD
jgi:hypothetical protein